jgi:hypothetical protein
MMMVGQDGISAAINGERQETTRRSNALAIHWHRTPRNAYRARDHGVEFAARIGT